MIELFDSLERVQLSAKLDYLIDTCFFVWIFEHQKEKAFEKFLSENDCAITSFNVEEINYIHNRLHGNIKHSIRKFLHGLENMKILEVPVHPGHKDAEHIFVKSIFPLLNEKEHDPSDAVLLAAAVKTRANVLTRDKHDIFNTIIEKTIKVYDIRVLNSFP